MKLKLASLKEEVRSTVSQQHQDTIQLSHDLFKHPEIGYEEYRSSERTAQSLSEVGFEVELGVYDLPTAFRATAGSGELHIGLIAEYDALPEIGHACGHNMIAATSVAAASALLPMVDELGITLTVFGTPAEELLGAGGKLLMLERGAFEGIHAALMVHPTPFETATPTMIAAKRLSVHMEGRPAHASAAPEQGQNAADALAIGQVALGLLRQQLSADTRVSGFTTVGGQTINVIPSHAEAEYALRAKDSASLERLEESVQNCFAGGAMAAGCSHTFGGSPGSYAELKTDSVLADLYRSNAEGVGRDFTEDPNQANFKASSDIGNVSQVLPTIQPFIGLKTWPVVNHQPDFANACVTPRADSTLADGAMALSGAIIDAATNAEYRRYLLDKGEKHVV